MGSSHSTRLPLHPPRRAATVLLFSILALGAAHAQGLDLRGPYAPYAPNVWRPSSATNAFAGLSLAGSHGASAGTLHLFSDYYFYDPSAHLDPALGPTVGSLVSGFRASTGVAGTSAPLSLFDNQPDPSQSLPYLGIGYSHLWLNNTLSLNADLGLESQNPWAASHLRGLPTGTQSLDDVTRDLRWSAVMAVNVKYSF
jgi:hypothetical protein